MYPLQKNGKERKSNPHRREAKTCAIFFEKLSETLTGFVRVLWYDGVVSKGSATWETSRQTPFDIKMNRFKQKTKTKNSNKMKGKIMNNNNMNAEEIILANEMNNTNLNEEVATMTMADETSMSDEEFSEIKESADVLVFDQ